MVTAGGIKNQIDHLWNIFYSNGVNNPLTAIEQITYLLFIRGLDELHIKKEAFVQEMELVTGEKVPIEKPIFVTEQQHKYRWSYLKEMSNTVEMHRLMRDEVFPFIKTLGEDETRDQKEIGFSRYLKNAALAIQEPSTLSRIIHEIDLLIGALEMLHAQTDEEGSAESILHIDTLGDLYEYLLMKLSTSGRNGQFRTPMHIRNMMVDLLQPTLEDRICDPAAGSSGFLISALQYILKHYGDIFTSMEKSDLKNRYQNDLFYGFDNDETMVRIGAMNMYLHGIDNPNIYFKNSLSKTNVEEEKYTMVIANPPFKGTVEGSVVAEDLTRIVPLSKSKQEGKTISQAKTELLFLPLILRLLKIGGRAAVIVPDGVLFGSSRAHVAVRKEIIDNHKLEAVISMPSGVFKPYAGVSTAILIFTKTTTGGTNDVWFYDMIADGYSLDDKRNKINDNDIPDIISRFRNLVGEQSRKRSEQSFFVSVEEIHKNNYDLSINRYKEVKYEEVQYEHPKVILTDIRKIQQEIIERMDALEDMIK
ncbi:class I SAM-dependent DNA methyltransferase [Priestia megaterium]|uniref:class I SAM-dependent DNA methyltransferase n=1 Tax=Priestia megaterium TaxID=1404 RepID=UPI00203F1A42|nr:class I SAM-dependent DNA methyltransferase [Priestia megaterium]MCM3541753.1 type I restriction-modification system subunit M [Priestia megaterium]